MYRILLFLIIAIIFALQNANFVTVKFLFWTFNAQLAYVIIGSLLLGIVLGILSSLYSRSKKKKQAEQLHEEVKHVEIKESNHPHIEKI